MWLLAQWTGHIPFFGSVFSRNCFEQIFWLLHVSKDDPNYSGEKINKVNDVLEILICNFQQSSAPGRNVSVDETMVGFRGRFAAKQYMPSKPNKYGMKAFTLADSKHGYLLNALVYTGADTLDSACSTYSTLPQPARIVLHLLQPYLHKGHTVFTDRYYTSIPLVLALQNCGTSFIGTAIKNHMDLPDAIRSPSFRLGNDEKIAFRCDQLLALGWRTAQKEKPLVMVSKKSSAKSVTVRSRATSCTALKPKVVDEYNLSMNGVDRADQYAVYYALVRKSHKWWRKLFFSLFEVTIVNSYILYRTTTTRPSSHSQFRRSLVVSLATRHMSTRPSRAVPGRPRKRPRVPQGDSERYNRHLNHFPAKGTRKECTVCSDTRHGARKRTAFYCKGLPQPPKPLRGGSNIFCMGGLVDRGRS